MYDSLTYGAMMSDSTPLMDKEQWDLVTYWMEKDMLRNAFTCAHGEYCAPGARVMMRGAAPRDGYQVDQVWWCTGCGDILPAAYNLGVRKTG